MPGIHALALEFDSTPCYWPSVLMVIPQIFVGTICSIAISSKRRLLVSGPVARAGRICVLETAGDSGCHHCRLCDMNEGPARSEARMRQDIAISTHVSLEVSEELRGASRKRRNSLRLPIWLTIRRPASIVNDLSSFLERETGRVDLDSVTSWFIFSVDFLGAGGCPPHSTGLLNIPEFL